MAATDVLPLLHSWPAFDRNKRFDLGHDFNWPESLTLDLSAGQEALVRQGIGTWECELSNNALTWSDSVFDMFGLPKNKPAARKITVALYRESSRVKMERLRAYAIKHHRGFTLDAEIVPANGGHRWIRLIAAPVSIDDRTVRLQGFKIDITHEYRLLIRS
ncbi:hypothetical protein BH09PSE3_BH09PSE3_06870 [soil metagenome]